MGEENAEIQRTLGRLEAKMDSLLASREEDRRALKELDQRVIGLEKDQHTGKALLAIAGGIIGAIATHIGDLIALFRGHA